MKAVAVDPFYQNFVDFTEEFCWGNVWIRPGLDRKTRSLLNLAMLSVMARWHEFEVHVRGALNNGVTKDEIAEVLLQPACTGACRSQPKRFVRRAAFSMTFEGKD